MVGGQLWCEEVVSVLCWGIGGEIQMLVGCVDRMVKYFSIEDGIFQGQRYCLGGEGMFCGFVQVDGIFIICVDFGIFRVWYDKDKDIFFDLFLELRVGFGVCRMC